MALLQDRPPSPGSDDEEEETPRPTLGPPLYGRVKLFSLERGYGFIRCDEGGDVYVTRMHVEKPKGLLRAGDRVVYHISKSERGPQAVKVRKIQEDGSEIHDVEAIVNKARQMTLEAVDRGMFGADKAHPLLQQRLAAVAGIVDDEGDDEEEDPEEVEARRKRALKRMLEQQAAARDLALAKQRREERQREAEERAAAFRTPTPPPVPEPLVPYGSSALLAESSLDVVRTIVTRRSADNRSSDMLAVPPADDRSRSRASTSESAYADAIREATAKALAAADDDIVAAAVAAAAPTNATASSASTTPAPCSSYTPSGDSMDDVVAAAVAAATAHISATPPAPATKDDARSASRRSRGHTPQSMMPPPHPSAFAKQPSPVTGAAGTAVDGRSLSRASTPSSVSPMQSIPGTKAQVEAEILTVAGSLRFHETELARLRRRMDALKQARASMIAASSAIEQTRLNLLVHNVVNAAPPPSAQ